jgi:hypothetical protein
MDKLNAICGPIEDIIDFEPCPFFDIDEEVNYADDCTEIADPPVEEEDESEGTWTLDSPEPETWAELAASDIDEEMNYDDDCTEIADLPIEEEDESQGTWTLDSPEPETWAELAASENLLFEQELEEEIKLGESFAQEVADYQRKRKTTAELEQCRLDLEHWEQWIWAGMTSH